MKFYLASRYSRRLELKGYGQELIALGHEVTARWLSGAHDGLVNTEDKVGTRGVWAQEDVEDIVACDVFVVFTMPVEDYRRGGSHVELGIALALNKRIISVGGHRPNVFYCLPQIECYQTWQDALTVLRGRYEQIS